MLLIANPNIPNFVASWSRSVHKLFLELGPAKDCTSQKDGLRILKENPGTHAITPLGAKVLIEHSHGFLGCLAMVAIA